MPHNTFLKRMRAECLVDEKFLCVKSDGAYARAAHGGVIRPHVVKADLGAGRRIASAS